jgi:DNA modification methylase
VNLDADRVDDVPGQMTVPYWSDDTVTLYHGDCLDVLAGIPDDSVHAIVTDPPYGLGFMGKAWDDLPPGLPWAQECLRVLKPGGHLLSFGGTRTWHRLAVAVEDAGFEVRDSIAWLYGSGFPKSLDVSKAVDKLDAAEERRRRALEFTAWFRSTGITRQKAAEVSGLASVTNHYFEVTAQPAIATADIFDKLRPYLPDVPERIEELVRQRTVESENIKARGVISEKPAFGIGGNGVLGGHAEGATARVLGESVNPAAQQWAGWGTALKPAFEPIVVARKPLIGTVAGNVLAHGTGAINVDGCRVGTDSARRRNTAEMGYGGGNLAPSYQTGSDAGRWPTNVVLDGSQAAELDRQAPNTGAAAPASGATFAGASGRESMAGGFGGMGDRAPAFHADRGGASRFFPTFRYEAKAPTVERPRADDTAHPTVKPLDLMRWLVRLVTPPGGTVLDPFAGSGTTGEACVIEGASCVLIEREAAYLPLIVARLAKPIQPDLFGLG